MEELVTGLNVPWDLDFTPDGTMLFTEREGVLSARLTNGTVQTITADMSDFTAGNEGGLMAILVDPGFSSNRRFYTCQAHANPWEVQVIAWTINSGYTEATRVKDPLVGGIPGGVVHSGCRLRVGPDGYLWIATGDGQVGLNPQDKTSLGGKVLRVVASTGAGAPGNPFISNSNANAKRVYTFGHRNVQGLARRPSTRQMWSVEHGPRVDDEINLLTAGGNYGWDPVPDYNDDAAMTDLTKFPDAVEAKWSSGSSSLATSGGIFLEGAHWGAWEGRLAVATLKNSTLRLFEFASDGALESEYTVPELDGTYGRLRTPMMGPDGALYVTTSNESNDKILQISTNSPRDPPPPPQRGGGGGAPGGGGGGGGGGFGGFGAPANLPPLIGGDNRPSYAENGTEPVVTYTVEDPDADDEIKWSVEGLDSRHMEISQDGALSFKEPPDYEDPVDSGFDNTYEVTLRATDDGSPALDDIHRVRVTVTNVNEPPLISGPSTVEFEENEEDPVATYMATDPEGVDVVTWALAGDDAGLFSISVAGVLAFNDSPDYEEPRDADEDNIYNVTLKATDPTEVPGTLDIAVTVTDVEDDGIVGIYDADGNGIIDRSEAIAAVSDYFADLITKSEAVEVVTHYFIS